MFLGRGSLLFNLIIFVIFVAPFYSADVFAKDTLPVDSIQLEYELRSKALKRRYEAFIAHDKYLQEQELLRSKGIQAHKKLRSKLIEKEEATREDFVKNRRPPKDESIEEKKYLEQLKKREIAEESQRIKFVDRKNRLQSLLKNEAAIPETKEVGLE